QALLGPDQQLGHAHPPEIAGRTSTQSSGAIAVSSPPLSPLTKTLMWRRIRPRSSRIQPCSAGRSRSSVPSSSATVTPATGSSPPPASVFRGPRRRTRAMECILHGLTRAARETHRSRSERLDLGQDLRDRGLGVAEEHRG